MKDEISALNDSIQNGLLDNYEVGVEIDDADFTQQVADAAAALDSLGVTGNDVGDTIAASLGGSVEVVGYEEVPVKVDTGKDSKGNVTKTVSGSIPYVDENGNVTK